jgi:heterotetrameric sarcosine oxidase delta subunit
MRIPCPHCGSRDVREFSYLGDATLSRPDPTAPDARARFTDYVYLRDNPAGPHREYWYHGSGCYAVVVVTRDVRNHVVIATSALKAPSGAASIHGPDGEKEA